MNIRIATALGIAVLGIAGLSSCKSDSSSSSTSGNWVTKSSIPRHARAFAASFVIDDYAYVGTGITDNNVRLSDLFRYSPRADDSTSSYTWQQMSSMPESAVGRNFAVGFAAAGKGFIGTGYDGNNYLNDFWKYDPATNTWDSVTAQFPGEPRYGAIAFGIGNTGYVTCGYTGSDEKDFYSYDAVNNVWTNKGFIPAYNREFGSCFVINNIAYIFGGSSNGSLMDDMYAYDPSTDTWTKKSRLTNATSESFDDDYSGITRVYGAAFTVGSKGYISTGNSSTGTSSSTVTTTWEYEPTTDRWTAKSNFEGSSRQGAVGLSILGRGFLLCGNSGSTYYNNNFEFLPGETLVDGD